ncbi:MAG: hypothetical protein AAGI71_11435 [Bacteroidota bacterium]
METRPEQSPPHPRWRIVGWSAAGLLLLLPLVAMPFTDEVHWKVGDFALAATFFLTVGLCYELTVRKTGNAAYRAGMGLALVAALLLVWVNGAVGIIGSEDSEANALYFGVLGIGLVGAFLARFQPRGMARALWAAALAQAAVTAGAVLAGLGAPESGPVELITLSGFFVVLFAGSAALFERAATQAPTADGPQ